MVCCSRYRGVIASPRRYDITDIMPSPVVDWNMGEVACSFVRCATHFSSHIHIIIHHLQECRIRPMRLVLKREELSMNDSGWMRRSTRIRFHLLSFYEPWRPGKARLGTVATSVPISVWQKRRLALPTNVTTKQHTSSIAYSHTRMSAI